MRKGYANIAIFAAFIAVFSSLALLSSNAFSQTTYSADDFFLTLIENVAGPTYGRAVFEFKNPLPSDLTVDSGTFLIRMDELGGATPTQKISKYVLEITLLSDNITDYSDSCQSITQENGTHQICSKKPSGWHIETYTKIEWKPFSSYTFKAGQTYRIKIEATWPLKKGENSREWFPQVKSGPSLHEQSKWAVWNASWTYYKNYTILSAVSTNQVNFTVLLGGTGGIDTKSLISAGKLNADCTDLRFIDENNNQLKWEWANFNSPFGCNQQNTSIYVKVPTIRSDNTTKISMYYGNPSTTLWDNDTAGTWNSSYVAVWHLDDCKGSNPRDSTGNAFHAAFGATGPPIWVNNTNLGGGNIKGCALMAQPLNDLTSYKMSKSSEAAFSTNGTAEVWVNSTNYVGSEYALPVISSGVGSWSSGWTTAATGSTTNRCNDFVTGAVGTELAVNSHFYCAIYLNSTRAAMTQNGVETSSVTRNYVSDSNMLFFVDSDSSNDFTPKVNMTIDEVRISNYPFTLDRIKATYRSFQSAMYAEGTEQLVSDYLNTTESSGRTAIESGIRSALGSSVPIYTDQQIYVRNLTNYQQLARFDKATKYGGQIWAFNFDENSSASFANMPNITPSFYTSEFFSLTQSQIISRVSGLINSTKR